MTNKKNENTHPITKLIIYIVSRCYDFKRWYHDGIYDRKHVVLKLKELKLSISWMGHNDFTDMKQVEIDQLKVNKNPAEYLNKCFEIAKGCNFIIFNCGNGMKYTQFWIGERFIDMSFFMNDQNKLFEHKYSVMGILSKLGFMYKQDTTTKIKPYTYELYNHNFSDRKVEEIRADFRNSKDLAIKFTIIVLRDMYKEDLSQLKCTVG